jgi:alcohol dehydrogenase class IV
VVLGAARELMSLDAAVDVGVREFHASQPTRIAAGSGIAERVGRYAASYGDRALLVVGESHARVSGLLARVQSALLAEGVAVEVLEGVGGNPTASVVDAGAMLARAWRADVIVALGGGSVVDAAKAIATVAAAPGHESFRTHLSGLRSPGLLVTSALPVVALPTLPGSGSETNGTSVITDDETGRKLSAHSDLAAPRIALLDPELVLDAPVELVGPGLADAWCHALEAGLSTSSTIASDALAEQALRMLQREAATPLHGEDRAERAASLTRAWWATNLAGLALTHAGSLVTHPLAHPLSARLDARHGDAVAALEPAVLAAFAERFQSDGRIVQVARWLDVRGADDPEVALRGVLTKLGRYCTSLGVRASVADLGLGEQLVADVVRDARASGSRGLSNLPGGEPSAEELFAVLDLAREHGPATPAKRLLEAAAGGRAG